MSKDRPYSIRSVDGVLCWRTHCDHEGCSGLEWAERERSGPMVPVGCGHPSISSGCSFAPDTQTSEQTARSTDA